MKLKNVNCTKLSWRKYGKIGSKTWCYFQAAKLLHFLEYSALSPWLNMWS